MSPEQIATATDEQVCDPFAKGYIVQRERELRGLSDCGPGAVECKKMGYNPGSPAYLQCRQMYMQLAMQQAVVAESARQQIIQNFNNSWQQNHAPQPSTTSYTTCGPGNTNTTINCRTTSP